MAHFLTTCIMSCRHIPNFGLDFSQKNCFVQSCKTLLFVILCLDLISDKVKETGLVALVLESFAVENQYKESSTLYLHFASLFFLFFYFISRQTNVSFFMGAH